jgi:MFS family permease
MRIDVPGRRLDGQAGSCALSGTAMRGEQATAAASAAFRFVLVMGAVSLFADMTYEGGASVNGPFLGTLGASAAAVSVVAGVGEFLGYALRSVFGYWADKSGRYWPLTFVGYVVNLFAVPAMAIAPSWGAAAAFMLAERTGRALRKPTVEAMLSYSTGALGRGWVYGLHTALDETGATLGPLLMAWALARTGGYRTSYVILLAPAALAIVALTAARLVFPVPSRLEGGRPTAAAGGFSGAYWLYMTAAAFFAAGLMSFEFVSYHLSRSGVVTGEWIPLGLAISTGIGVVASLVLGALYDRVGVAVVVGAVCLTAVFPPLVFWGGFPAALVGLVLWGVGYATQDTLFKALIASVLPAGRRNFAFGVFYVGYGAGWVIGSVVTGLLYERSHAAVVGFAVAVQLVSVPLFVLAARRAALPVAQHP